MELVVVPALHQQASRGDRVPVEVRNIYVELNRNID